MKPKNDPIRLRRAWIRVACAVLAAVIFLAVPGFRIFSLLGGGQKFETFDDVQSGAYVQKDVCLILDYFASGYKGDTVKEKYAVVPIGGKMVAVCLPSRWFESADTIHDNTTALLSGTSFSLDSYILVRGTVKPMPEAVSAQLYSWFGENKEWMEKGGMISEVEDYADYLPELMIQVDSAGWMPAWAVAALGVAAALCLVYAVVELLRIALRKYAPAPELVLTEGAAIPEEETADAADTPLDDITVEITEEAQSPETETLTEEPAPVPDAEQAPETEAPTTKEEASPDGNI